MANFSQNKKAITKKQKTHLLAKGTVSQLDEKRLLNSKMVYKKKVFKSKPIVDQDKYKSIKRDQRAQYG